MLAFSKTNEDDYFVGYLVTDHNIDRALRIEQYPTWHGASVVCLGGGGRHKNLGGRTLTQPRPDEFGMRQRSGEYFPPNPMLSFFCMDFALTFGGEDQKKKGLYRKILGYLITFTSSVLLFHRKSRLW